MNKRCASSAIRMKVKNRTHATKITVCTNIQERQKRRKMRFTNETKVASRYSSTECSDHWWEQVQHYGFYLTDKSEQEKVGLLAVSVKTKCLNSPMQSVMKRRAAAAKLEGNGQLGVVSIQVMIEWQWGNKRNESGSIECKNLCTTSQLWCEHLMQNRRRER